MTIRSPLTLAAVVIWLAVFLTLLRTTRAPLKDRDTARPGSDPVEEIELLRYENALLRSEQQRALSLGGVSERIRGHIGSGPTSGSDDGDDAWGALVDATVLRDALLSVCQDLQTAVRHVQLQLSSGVPVPEHDRRRSDNGRDAHPAGEASHPTTRNDTTGDLPGDVPSHSRLGQASGG